MRRFAFLLATAAILPVACNNAAGPGITLPDAGPSNNDAFAFIASGGKVALTGKNTKITFVGKKPEGKHDGGFKELKGETTILSIQPGGNTSPDMASIVSLNVEIDATSLYSDDEKLTQHLKSEDFFSVKEHPTIKFVSTECKGANGKPDDVTVSGNLTLRGVTKPFSFPVKINKEKFFYMTGEFKLNRSEFGMTFGKGKVDDEVSVKVVVGVEPKAPAKK